MVSNVPFVPPLAQVYLTYEELFNDELLQYGGLEFPQINYAENNGRPYRYVYACGFGHVFSDSLLKMDVRTKELKVSPLLAPAPSPSPTWLARYFIDVSPFMRFSYFFCVDESFLCKRIDTAFG